MDTILRVIDDETNDRQVKSIINSLNENQEKSKNWLIDKSKEYFDLLINPKICVAAGWYGHLANKLEKSCNCFLNASSCLCLFSCSASRTCCC